MPAVAYALLAAKQGKPDEAIRVARDVQVMGLKIMNNSAGLSDIPSVREITNYEVGGVIALTGFGGMTDVYKVLQDEQNVMRLQEQSAAFVKQYQERVMAGLAARRNSYAP